MSGGLESIPTPGTDASAAAASRVDPSSATVCTSVITLRPCRLAECDATREVINQGAATMLGLARPELACEPLLSNEGFARELVQGVAFWGAEVDGNLVAVAGILVADNCDIIKHLYVRPTFQREGIGSALLGLLIGLSRRRLVAGVWFETTDAVRFFLRMGFRPVNPGRVSQELLARHWQTPDGRPEATALMMLPSANATSAWVPSAREQAGSHPSRDAADRS